MKCLAVDLVSFPDFHSVSLAVLLRPQSIRHTNTNRLYLQLTTVVPNLRAVMGFFWRDHKKKSAFNAKFRYIHQSNNPDTKINLGKYPYFDSQETSVGILTAWTARVRFQAVHIIFTASRPAEAHPASYPMGTGGHFPRCNVADA
jgi:hypothetical protein